LNELWHAIADPWSGAIMQRAFAEVVLLGVAGGVIGCWVLLNDLAYGAESLPHAMFPGLVIAALGGFSLLAGGAVGVLVAAVAIALAGRTPRIGSDAAIAVVVTGLFGLGALLALSPATPARVQALLFGDILGLTTGDVIAAAALAIALVAALRFLHERLLIVSFDRTSAPSLGVGAERVQAALLALLALTVLIAVQALGNLLVVALLIAPAAAARLLTHRVYPMMLSAAGVAVGCGAAGLYASYYLDTAAGASIAAALVAAYAVTTLVRHDLA
jgi:ABC-type Mn2+/Zn2+ transport system permease subunit